MSEQSVFIPDNSPGMTIRDRNMQLGAEISAGLNANRNILRIVRESNGWRIFYSA